MIVEGADWSPPFKGLVQLSLLEDLGKGRGCASQPFATTMIGPIYQLCPSEKGTECETK
jgi:hypothetical protein